MSSDDKLRILFHLFCLSLMSFVLARHSLSLSLFLALQSLYGFIIVQLICRLQIIDTQYHNISSGSGEMVFVRAVVSCTARANASHPCCH